VCAPQTKKLLVVFVAAWPANNHQNMKISGRRSLPKPHYGVSLFVNEARVRL
jgi:hypothetical protein